MTYVLALPGIGLADADRVGRKAAVLGELMAAGFGVPAGFAITTDASNAMATELIDELRRGLATLGGGPMAVRSSGVDEDLAGMSYAGQYESVLNVRGLDATVDAVRTCWASAGARRVTAYRDGRQGPGRMGVLVQVMVDADAAGVAFTTNPLTGDPDETVINATRGLADRVVAGELDAQQWTVRGDTAVPDGSGIDTTPAITADQAREITRLAARVAARFGVAQDIEWAIGDGTLWLLQARPITALPEQPVRPVPIEIVVPAGFSTRNRAMDRPWTPMEHSVFLPAFSAAVRHIFAYTTRIEPSAHGIGGWTYITVPADYAGPSALRLEAVAADVAGGGPEAVIRQWHESWRPAFAREITGGREVAVANLSDLALGVHLHGLVELFGRLHHRYFQLTGAAIAIGAGLAVTCADLLGWSPEQTNRLRGGLTGDHMAATVRLTELARLAADRPAVREFLTGSDADPGRLSEVDPEFATLFADYIGQYAHRTIGFDLTEPTLAEQPGVLLALIRVQLEHPYDFAAERRAIEARIEQALDEAASALDGRDSADRARFAAAVAGGVQSGPVRDEKAFYAVSAWALMRRGVLELGRRLAERGIVDRADDAFFLGLDDALSALSSRIDQRGAIRHHRGQLAWALANPGPAAYGDLPAAAVEPQPALSPAAQRVSQAAQASMGLMVGARVEHDADGSLRGLAASAGRYLGPVRIVRDITEFGKLRYGDVLVCPETTAQWSILFPSVGALVTDRGSLLSHPAIIAREYRVPAVVATGTATSLLHDDMLVTVDGTTGVVRPVAEGLASGNAASVRVAA